VKSSSNLQRYGSVELAVRRAGEGMPLVWGHGLMGSMWVEDMAGLIDWNELARHAELVRFDAWGHGSSSGSYHPRDYRWERMAEDMLAIAESVADEQGHARYVLGGVSMGAATALAAAVQQPGRVAGLILALPPTAWDSRPRQAAIYRRMAWLSGVLGAAPYRLLDWLPKPVRDDGLSRLAMATIKGLARANPRYVQAALRGAALSDMPDPSTLKALKMPTLILAWEGDTAHPMATAEALADCMPDVRALRVISREKPCEWSDSISAFMDDVGAPNKRRKKVSKRRSST
jgi:pimeloyl-ACP methyl ester carboxylesterase